MFTQVELLDTNKNEYIYWIETDTPLVPGLCVKLFEEDAYLTIRRTFISLKDKLPPKARIGTIAEIEKRN
jgi:hypothetical protein